MDEEMDQGLATQRGGNSQTPPVSPENVLDHLPFHFGPLQQLIGDEKWMTELDRIQVLKIHPLEEPKFWCRLIGPGCGLNLKLETPQTDCIEGVMTATTEPIPERHEGLIDFKVNTRGCAFVDVYVFLRQHGLDEWTFFPEGSARDRCNRLLSWTNCILLCLVPPYAFDLEEIVSFSRPTFPNQNGQSMRYSVLRRTELLEAEWKIYSVWRFRQLTEMYIHELGLTEYEGQRHDARHSSKAIVNTGMIETHFQKMEIWQEPISVARHTCSS